MMNKSFHPILSEEKFAAWLDGMLNPIEMDEVSALIGSDNDMQSVLDSANTLDDTLSHYGDEFLYPEVFADPLSPADFESPELNLPTIIPDALSDQTNLIPDFLPDSGFDILQASDTPDTDNSPIADMGQDTNDINL
jgi:hypothetical protein